MDGGSQGFFINHSNGEGWNFIVPGSILWDALHQDLYFALHDFSACQGGEEKVLPPLPPVPKFKRLSWKDNFLPKEALSARAYPSLTARLESAHEKQIRVWILLLEDKYETLQGDGCFRYFFEKKVFLSEFDARTAANAGDGEGWHVLSVASVVIGLDCDEIVPVIFDPDVFDHYEFEHVVLALNDWIALGATDHP